VTPSDADILNWTIDLLDGVAEWERTPSQWAELGELISQLGAAAARGDVAAVQDAAAELDESDSYRRGPTPLRPAADLRPDEQDGPVLEVWTPIPPRIGADLELARQRVRELAGPAGPRTGR